MSSCATCNHGIETHGRRGHGACRVGRQGWLAQMVDMAQAAAIHGVPFEEIRAKVPIEAECECLRFRKTKP